MSNKQIHETLVVRVGVVGMADEGLGTAGVTIDLEDMTETEIGAALGNGFRAAHTAAIRDVGPKLTAAWAQQGGRLIDGDAGMTE